MNTTTFLVLTFEVIICTLGILAVLKYAKAVYDDRG